jgi:hypothetical protein
VRPSAPRDNDLRKGSIGAGRITGRINAKVCNGVETGLWNALREGKSLCRFPQFAE